MEADERRVAKARLVGGMLQGQPWRDAATGAGARTSRSSAYRWLQRIHSRGDAAFDDGRHGHASKVRAPVRQWLDACCRGAPMVSGPAVQQALHERFGLIVSVRHINRVRAALNVTKLSCRVSTGRTGEDAATDSSSDTTWRDGAGGLLLLAAAHGTGLIPAFEAALPGDDDHLARLSLTSKRSLLLTLLFLNAVGLRRTWDLRAYAGDSLALLTGRHRAYGYRYVECFLSHVAHADGAETLTDALATWTALLWRPCPSSTAASLGLPPTFYIDGHRKAVYSDHLIPRGLVARRGTVLGCRALTLLHDAQGHPLLATTDRGDLHLTVGAPALLRRFAWATDAPMVRRLVIDREGMAAEFLRQLAGSGCDVVTVLRADQYAGLASFTDVGPFVPLHYGRHGTLVRKVAPAHYSLALPDHPGERLNLRVALVRAPRTHVLCPQPPATSHAPYVWLDDLNLADTMWYREGWTATAAPAAPTELKLIPIVTTAVESDVDAAELAQTYFDRWPHQENCIKDWLLDLGLDTNHGYAKRLVENSEVAKRRAELEKRLANAARWAQGARVRYDQAIQPLLESRAGARTRSLLDEGAEALLDQ